MIIYLCLKCQYNTSIFSKDIVRKPKVLRTGRKDGTDGQNGRTYGQQWYYMPPPPPPPHTLPLKMAGHNKTKQGMCHWMHNVIRNNNIYGLGERIWIISEIFGLWCNYDEMKRGGAGWGMPPRDEGMCHWMHLIIINNNVYGLGQGSGKPENSRSGPKIRILDRFQIPQNANNSVQQVCALNPIFSPTNQFSGINDV